MPRGGTESADVWGRTAWDRIACYWAGGLPGLRGGATPSQSELGTRIDHVKA